MEMSSGSRKKSLRDGDLEFPHCDYGWSYRGWVCSQREPRWEPGKVLTCWSKKREGEGRGVDGREGEREMSKKSGSSTGPQRPGSGETGGGEGPAPWRGQQQARGMARRLVKQLEAQGCGRWWTETSRPGAQAGSRVQRAVRAQSGGGGRRFERGWRKRYSWEDGNSLLLEINMFMSILGHFCLGLKRGIPSAQNRSHACHLPE